MKKTNPKAMSCRLSQSQVSSLSHLFLKHDYSNRSISENPNKNKINNYYVFNMDNDSRSHYQSKRCDRNSELVDEINKNIDKLYELAKNDYIKHKKAERKEVKKHNAHLDYYDSPLPLPRANFQIKRDKCIQEVIITAGNDVDPSKINIDNVMAFVNFFEEKYKVKCLIIAEHNDEKSKHYHIQWFNYSFSAKTSLNKVRDMLAVEEAIKYDDYDENNKPNMMYYRNKQMSELQEKLAEIFGTEFGEKKVEKKDHKTKYEWLQEITNQIEDKEIKLSGLNKSISSNQVEIEKLKKQKQELEEEIQKKKIEQEKLNKSRQEAEELTNNKAKLKSSIKALQSIISSLKSSIGSLLDKALDDPAVKTKIDIKNRILSDLHLDDEEYTRPKDDGISFP